MVKLVFYLLYCCAAIKSCGLSGILFKAIHNIKTVFGEKNERKIRIFFLMLKFVCFIL